MGAAPDPGPSPVAAEPRRGLVAALAALLVAATLVAYAGVLRNGFVRFDDPIYLTENPHVARGLTLEGIGWAFTTGHAANWHPLTWIAHMADVELFGMDAAGHHAVGVLLHATSAVLLLLLLVRTTGALLRSAFVAGVFALHPLHVESVAWAAERKDVLSTLLGLLALLAWTSWTARGGRGRYLAALALYALALLAKPMLVALPAVMGLLDLWPLRRLAPGRRGSIAGLVREKVPFLALAAAVAVVTLVVQRAGGSMGRLPDLPLGLRLGNALVAYVAYLGKAVWPAGLAVFYPFPLDGIPVWKVALSGAALWVATVVAVRAWRTRPYVAVGWLWFLVTLLPVIGIVQVGRQSMADRYVYLPLVGPSILVAWGAPALLRGVRAAGAVRTSAGVAALAACLVLTRHQVATWRDDVALFGHARAVTERNWLAQYAYAGALARQGRAAEAIEAYREALAIHADFVDKRIDFGGLLEAQGDLAGAEEQYRAAVAIQPENTQAHARLGAVLAGLDRLAEAEVEVAEAERLDARAAESLRARGVLLAARGRREEACVRLRTAVELDPELAPARRDLGVALIELGGTDAGVAELREALRLDPSDAVAARAIERAGP